jgi:hypothetical protein
MTTGEASILRGVMAKRVVTETRRKLRLQMVKFFIEIL